MNKIYYFLIMSIILVSLVGCSTITAPTPISTEASKPCVGKAITFGEISEDPNEVTTSKQPFANYLANQLADSGYECGKIKVVDTMHEMITLINNGEVDIYMDSMYPATIVSDATGAQPVLRRWRNCDPDYYSVLFTTADRGISSIQDLSGHMIAMDQIYSTSGFVLPATYLIDHGLKLVLKDTYEEPVAENEVGIYFSLDDKNTLNLVLEGKVLAGATDDYYFNKWGKELQEQEGHITLVKLAETASVSRQVVLVQSGLGSDVQAAIKNELLNAHLNPAGIAAMKQDADTCKYDEPPEGIQATFTQMQEMQTKIMEIPGWQEAFQKDQ